MAINLGAAYVDIVPSTKGLADKVRQETEGPLEREGTRAGQTWGSAFSRIGSQLAAGLGRAISTAATVGTTAIAGMAGSVAVVGGQYNSLEATTRKVLTTILGSADAAEVMVSQLMDFASSSPFPREAFLQGTQQMLAFGFAAENVIPTLAAIQDAVAAMGGGANEIADMVDIFSKIQSQGAITSVEIMRLGIRGVDAIKLMAEAAGVSVADMKKRVSEGEVGSQEAITGILAGMNRLYGGAAGQVKGLWDGVIQSVQARWRNISSDLMEPLISKMGGGAAITFVNAIADSLSSLRKSVIPELVPYVESLGAGMVKVAEGIGRFVGSITGAGVSGFVEDMRGLSSVIAPVAAALGAIGLKGLASQIPVIGGFLPVINPLVAALAGLVAVSPELRAVFEGLFGAIGKVLGEVGQKLLEGLAPSLPTIVEALTLMAEAFAEILVALLPIVPVLADLVVLLVSKLGVPVLLALATGLEAIATAATMLGPVFPIVVGGLIALNAAIGVFNAVLAANPIVLLVAGIVALIGGLILAYRHVEGFRNAVDSVARAIVGAAGWIADLAVSIGGFFSQLPGTIAAAFNAVVAWFSSLPGIIWNALSALPGVLIDVFVTAITNLPMAIGYAIGALVAVFLGIPGLILYGLWSLGNWLWDRWLFPAMSALPGLLMGAAEAVLGFFMALPGRILTAIGDFASFIWQNVFVRAFMFWTQQFPVIAAGVFQWFTELPGRILGFLVALPGMLLNLAKSALSIGSGLLAGLVSGAVAVFDWFVALPGVMLSKLGSLGRILLDAGKKIMAGLKDGLVEGFKDVAGYLTSIPGKIIDLKGPPEYDAKFLIPNGRLIMDGLLKGIQQGWGFVQSSLENISTTIPSLVAPAINLGASSGSYVDAAQVINQYFPNAQINLRDQGDLETLDWWTRSKLALVAS